MIAIVEVASALVLTIEVGISTFCHFLLKDENFTVKKTKSFDLFEIGFSHKRLFDCHE